MVVSDLAVLHDEAKIAASADLVVAFVYLVLRGIDVVTMHQWRSALEDGGLGRLSRLHHTEVRLVSKWSVSFSEALRVECPKVRRAFKRAARMPGSQLEVVDAAAGASNCGSRWRRSIVAVCKATHSTCSSEALPRQAGS